MNLNTLHYYSSGKLTKNIFSICGYVSGPALKCGSYGLTNSKLSLKNMDKTAPQFIQISINIDNVYSGILQNVLQCFLFLQLCLFLSSQPFFIFHSLSLYSPMAPISITLPAASCRMFCNAFVSSFT